jgi:hypothetical protein
LDSKEDAGLLAESLCFEDMVSLRNLHEQAEIELARGEEQRLANPNEVLLGDGKD